MEMPTALSVLPLLWTKCLHSINNRPNRFERDYAPLFCTPQTSQVINAFRPGFESSKFPQSVQNTSEPMAAILASPSANDWHAQSELSQHISEGAKCQVKKFAKSKAGERLGGSARARDALDQRQGFAA